MATEPLREQMQLGNGKEASNEWFIWQLRGLFMFESGFLGV